jgi:hypothetical protein
VYVEIGYPEMSKERFMIFLSHNFKDKPVVEQFAIPLRAAFGQDHVFYDSWSIQPGEGIIDRMNSGLTEASLFFFFVSQSSLASDMVKLEWQNALMKAAKGRLRFIPIRMDASPMPAILTQTVYLDLFSNGLAVTQRQVMDLAKGNNVFEQQFKGFSNVVGTYRTSGQTLEVTLKAAHFLEPVCEFLFITKANQDDYQYEVLNETMFGWGFGVDQDFGDQKVNFIKLSKHSALVPGFPFRVKLTPNPGRQVTFDGVYHRKSEDSWEQVLLTAAN